MFYIKKKGVYYFVTFLLKLKTFYFKSLLTDVLKNNVLRTVIKHVVFSPSTDLDTLKNQKKL